MDISIKKFRINAPVKDIDSASNIKLRLNGKNQERAHRVAGYYCSFIASENR